MKMNLKIDPKLLDDEGFVTVTGSSTTTFKHAPAVDYKFDESKYIAELQRYVNGTYTQHYSTNKFQSTEVIMDRGHGTGFCMGNVDKYSNRYGKKGTREDARKDLMKVLHYALLQLYVHDNELG